MGRIAHRLNHGVRAGCVAVLFALVFAPTGAAGAGGFKGRFGAIPFKARKITVACGYVRGTGLFVLEGAQIKVNIRARNADIKFASLGGAGADPTAPGAAFPIQLGSTFAAFINAQDVGIGIDPRSIPGWVAEQDDGLQITLTGFKRGRITGTFSGTLQPAISNSNGPLTASGSFKAACVVQ